MRLKIYQVDAFADVLFTGNPAAVCPLDVWLPERTMQQIAFENNLSETAFFVAEGDGYRIRWFTPTTEVDLCGHATIASAFVLRHFLGVKDAVSRFASNSGELLVTHRDGWYFLNFPVDTITPADSPEAFERSTGLKPLECYKGRTDYLFVLRDEEQVRSAKPDLKVFAEIDARGAMITAPSRDFDFVSRFFGPQSGVDEDPVTGSAHTTLIPYWSKRLGKTEMVAKQVSQRGGVVQCRLLGDRVEIGGQAVAYLTGEIEV